MYKFTVFTIIFSIIIVFVVMNLIITDFRSDDSKTSTSPSQVLETSPGLQPNTPGKVKFDIGESGSGNQNVKVLTDEFWAKNNIDPKEIASKEYNDRIFKILSPDKNGILKVYKNFIKSGDLEGMEIYEIITADSESAKANYDDMFNSANKSILYSPNETNDFGDHSFYLNDELKIDSVSLIILKNNVIYAFAYNNSQHQYFINIFKELP